MAKHPHKLLFVNNQTWKCQLEGCAFFVHKGLQHVLVGKRAICWNCDEIFVISEASLKDGKPKCDDCRLFSTIPVVEDKPSTINISDEKRRLNDEMFGRGNWEHAFDQIEIHEPAPVKEKKLHAPDCASWLGAECNCR